MTRRRMNVKSTVDRRLLAALALTVAMSGCYPTAPSGTSGTPTLGVVGDGTAAFLGQVTAPGTLVANNSAGLIANNSAGLVANNSAGYLIAGLSDKAVARSFVYLSNPDEQMYQVEGKPVTATTDEQGFYKVGIKLPAGHHVIVNSMLEGNRRLVGYGFSKEGENQVDVSLETTYVVEFLRYQAKKAGKTFKDYDLGKLPEATRLTEELGESGRLPIPDLTVGHASRINNTYVTSFGSSSKGLSDFWKSVLGARPVAVTTFAGNYQLGDSGDGGAATQASLWRPAGVATHGASGSFVTYLADESNHLVRRVDAQGTITTFVGIPTGDASTNIPDLAADDGTGFAREGARIPYPRAMVTDAAGNLILTPNNFATPYATDFHVVLFVCNTSGTYYGRAMEAGRIYRLGAPSSRTLAESPPSGATVAYKTRGYAGDGQAVYPNAKFQYIPGMTLDDAGNLYLVDQINHLVRRIDRGTGVITRVAGVLNSGGTAGLRTGQVVSGVATLLGDGGDAKLASFNFPAGIAWRRAGASSEELYVVDGSNHRIRKIASADGFQTSTISTVAGTGTAGTTGDGGAAADAQIHLGNLPAPGGIAIDPGRGQLYFVQPTTGVIRGIDLGAGTIRTLAGGGTHDRDGEARDVRLLEPTHLTVAPDGSLIFSDRINYVLRRLHLQFGE